MYENRQPPEEPPCNDCRIDPIPENVQAISLFRRVQYQLIMGMGGPVDVSHEAMHRAMDLYDIEDRKRCFTKMLALSRWWIGKITKK